VSTSSHLDEKSFEQLLAAAYTLQQQQRRPVLVPNGRAAGASATSQRKTVAVNTGKPSTNKVMVGAATTTGSAALARRNSSTEVEEAERLAMIAETQAVVHKNQLSLSQALELIATSAADITQASGAAIWLVQGSSAVCRAVAGSRKDAVGQRMEIATGRLAACLDRDEVLRIWNTQAEDFSSGSPELAGPSLANPGGFLLAVPIHHEGRVQGALEVILPCSRHFVDADLRTCQILSGLVSEAIALAAGQEWKHVLDSERATLLEALDRIQPHLARLLSEVEAKPEPKPAPRKELRPVAESPSGNGLARSRSMARLGEYLLTQQERQADAERFPDEDLEDEGFEAPGIPGRILEAPLNSIRVAPREVQTALNLSVATAPTPTQRSIEASDSALRSAVHDADDDADDLLEIEEEADAAPAIRYTKLLARTAPSIDHAAPSESENAVDEGASAELVADLVIAPEPIYSEAKDLPERNGQASLQAFLAQRWADVCLAVSAGILALSLVWAFWPHAAAPGRRGAANQPALTPFEQLLVAVGLAEVPAPTAVYAGSPNAQVWVDMHTALYYCSGADEFGKTEKGRFLTQHEAQYQQFQPAHDRACD